MGFALAEEDRGKLTQAFGLKEIVGPVYAVIWTTTPWTIPSNQALNVHPDHEYALVKTERGNLILANEILMASFATREPINSPEDTARIFTPQILQRYGLKQWSVIGLAKGQKLEHIRFCHPFYDRYSPIYLGDYVTLEQGTGIVHSAPAYGIEDFESCKRYGMKDDEILSPVTGIGKFAESLEIGRAHV